VGVGDFYWGPSDRMDRKKLQVPPLRYAPVGMTKWKLVIFIRGRQIGWTERNSRSLHYASLRSG
jgi:hypothetical protein